VRCSHGRCPLAQGEGGIFYARRSQMGSQDYC
jgi:hypothetical protein